MADRNLTLEEMQERIGLYSRLARTIEEMKDIRSKLWELEKDYEVQYWGNARVDFWEAICEKYQLKDLLSCYGDIFFILEKGDNWYIGRRILWNLGLSDEKYEITVSTDADVEGNFNYYEYDIKVITD